MNSFFTLTKTLFLTGFATNKKKKNQKSTFKTLIIFGIVFFVMSCLYNLSMIAGIGTPTGPQMSYNDYLVTVLSIGGMITFIYSLFQMQNAIFKTKDYEFLESLPISKKTVVAAKISAVYIMNLFEDIIIALPAVILYTIYTQNYIVAVLAFVSIFFVSLIPLLITSLVGSLVALISSRMKKKNVFNIIFYAIFMVGLFYFSFSMNSSQGDNLVVIIEAMPWFKLLLASFADLSKWYLYLIFILVNVVAFLGVVLFIASVYRPINTRLNSFTFHEEYKSDNKDTNLSLSKLLFKKELKMLTGKSNYFINSLLGPIMYVILGACMIFGTISAIEGDPEITDDIIFEVGAIMVYISASFGIQMNCMATTTSASISLEGPNFEMLSAFPVEPKEYINAKLKVGIIIPSLMNLVAGPIVMVFAIIKMGFRIEFPFMFILTPILACISTAYCGMLCGLKWHKFDFENDMQVIKNGACSTFTMLFAALPALLIMIFQIVVSIVGVLTPELHFFVYIGAGVPIVIYAILIVVFRALLNKKGVALFKKAIIK